MAFIGGKTSPEENEEEGIVELNTENVDGPEGQRVADADIKRTEGILNGMALAAGRGIDQRDGTDNEGHNGHQTTREATREETSRSTGQNSMRGHGEQEDDEDDVPVNPLIGKNLDEFGPRFPDQSNVYDKDLRAKLTDLSVRHGIPMQEGVYLMMSGPCYETPAEIRMARIIGADAVGMSTIPETMCAAHCGIKVLGISLITNMAAGVLDQPLSHAEVTETAAKAAVQFTALVDLILKEIF